MSLSGSVALTASVVGSVVKYETCGKLAIVGGPLSSGATWNHRFGRSLSGVMPTDWLQLPKFVQPAA